MKKITVKNYKELEAKVTELKAKGYEVISIWRTHCELQHWAGGRIISICLSPYLYKVRRHYIDSQK